MKFSFFKRRKPQTNERNFFVNQNDKETPTETKARKTEELLSQNTDNIDVTPTQQEILPEQKMKSPSWERCCALKSAYPNYIILHWVNEYIEVYDNDAIITAKALECDLTTRDFPEKAGVPMCCIRDEYRFLYMHLLTDRGHDLIFVDGNDISHWESNRRDAPIESQPIGRIEYYYGNYPPDKVEFTTYNALKRTIRDDCDSGHCMGVYLYTDANGSRVHFNPHFVENLEGGVRFEYIPTPFPAAAQPSQAELARIKALADGINLPEPDPVEMRPSVVSKIAAIQKDKAAVKSPCWEKCCSIKDQNPDSIVLYLVNDHIEVYGDDAIIAAKAWRFDLTTHDFPEKAGVPMCSLNREYEYLFTDLLTDRGHDLTVVDGSYISHWESNRKSAPIESQPIGRVVFNDDGKKSYEFSDIDSLRDMAWTYCHHHPELCVYLYQTEKDPILDSDDSAVRVEYVESPFPAKAQVKGTELNSKFTCQSITVPPHALCIEK